jgi:nucleoside-diphosphate-sugar epimerase
MTCVVLGAGYTGSRVVRLLEARGHSVRALRRADFDIEREATWPVLEALAPGAAILHSIPVLRLAAGYRPTMPTLVPLMAGARRVVYLSTTGVYGEAESVDETTAVAPRHAREQLRVEEEQAVLQGAWSGLVLRPAAIYGPDRGIHISMKEGTYRLVGAGDNVISRIHADDLARIAAAALLSALEGAYPVADRHACPAREIAAYCARRFALPYPPGTDALAADDTRRSNRRVNGRAILERLELELEYPSYREGLAGLPDSGGEFPARYPGPVGQA